MLHLTNSHASVPFTEVLFCHVSTLYHFTARSHSSINEVGVDKSMGKLAACLKLQDEVVLHNNSELVRFLQKTTEVSKLRK